MVINGNGFIKQGVLEVWSGCMFSGKTKNLIKRVDPLQFVPRAKYIFIKPKIDTRKTNVRKDPLDYGKWVYVDQNNPREILEIAQDCHFVAIDEAHFFGENFGKTIEELLIQGKNVGIAGLDLDFKGEPFGQMPYLLSIANEVYKGAAVCQYGGCGAIATRTQRLVNKKPASYDDPLVAIEGEATYEPRCLKHHEVPGKPKLKI